jgi:transposase
MPQTPVKVLFYASADGIRSSRRISKACRENVVYFYLSGNYHPDHRTISDFRKNNLELFPKILK